MPGRNGRADRDTQFPHESPQLRVALSAPLPEDRDRKRTAGLGRLRLTAVRSETQPARSRRGDNRDK